MKYVNQREYPDIPYVTRANPEDPHHERGKSTTIKSSGCGLCSAIMVADRLLPDFECSLEEAIAISYEAQANRSAGTARKFFPAFAEKFSLVCERASTLEELLNCLRTGGAAVVLVSEVKGERVGLFTHGGHYMAIIGEEPDGRLAILDPSYFPGKYDEEGREGKVEVKNEFIALCTGVLKPEKIAETARFLISTMSLLFIAPTVGILSYWGVILPNLVPIIVIVLVSTVLVFTVSGLVTQAMLTKEGGDDHG